MVTLLDTLAVPKNIIFIKSTALNTEIVPGSSGEEKKKINRHFLPRQVLNKDQCKITFTDTHIMLVGFYLSP